MSETRLQVSQPGMVGVGVLLVGLGALTTFLIIRAEVTPSNGGWLPEVLAVALTFTGVLFAIAAAMIAFALVTKEVPIKSDR